MRETTGDLWQLADYYRADMVCVTTNLRRAGSGRAVMSAGVAKHVRDNIRLVTTKEYQTPLPDARYGEMLRKHVFNTTVIGRVIGATYKLVAFPTKIDWRNPSDLDLIVRSAHHLSDLAYPGDICLLPRPGCGLGGLSWEDEVRPRIRHLMHDGIIVVGRE